MLVISLNSRGVLSGAWHHVFCRKITLAAEQSGQESGGGNGDQGALSLAGTSGWSGSGCLGVSGGVLSGRQHSAVWGSAGQDWV